MLGADLARMRVARLSRGDDPRWLWQIRGAAATAGTLFIRAYERGERVYAAMLARGYPGTGEVRAVAGRSGGTSAWLRAMTPPVLAAGSPGPRWPRGDVKELR